MAEDTLDIPALADQFTSNEAWQKSGNDGRRQLVRDFAIQTRGQFGTPAEQNALVQELWNRQDSTNLESVLDFVGSGVKEALVSMPSMAGAVGLAAGDAVGVSNSGSGQRLKQGILSVADQTAQRIKSFAPKDNQELRDAGLVALKTDIDAGNVPPGFEDWLSGTPVEKLDPDSRAYVEGASNALVETAVKADHGDNPGEKLIDRYKQSDRSLLFDLPQGRTTARQLLADYVATGDPGSWKAFSKRTAETDAQNTAFYKTLQDKDKFAGAAKGNEGLTSSLIERSMSMQESPIDLATAGLPFLFGAKALHAAKAGGAAAAVKEIATGVAAGAAEEGATTYFSDATATTGDIASDAALGAIGEGAFTVGGAAIGSLTGDSKPAIKAAVPVALAESTGDTAAAEVIRQAAVVAESTTPLSTAPAGDVVREELNKLDLSRPITDEALGIQPLNTTNELPQSETPATGTPIEELSADGSVSGGDGAVSEGSMEKSSADVIPNEGGQNSEQLQQSSSGTQDSSGVESAGTDLLTEIPEQSGPAVATNATEADTLPITFKTARGGSEYIFENGKTVRNKKASNHPNHQDSGIKEKSNATVFVDEKSAGEIGVIYTEAMIDSDGSKKRANIQLNPEGNIELTWYDGKDAQGNLKKRVKIIPAGSQPAVGLSPVEFMERSRHLGSPITEVSSPQKQNTNELSQSQGTSGKSQISNTSSDDRKSGNEIQIGEGRLEETDGSSSRMESSIVDSRTNQLQLSSTSSEIGLSLESSREADTIIQALSNRGRDIRREENPDNDSKEFASKIKELTGRDVVFVRGKGTAGATLPGSNTVVVNLDSKQSVKKLIGHEVAHTLEGTQEFEALRDSLKTTDAVTKLKSDLEGMNYSESELDNEIIADVVGENLNNRKFWRSLSQDSPTVFQRVGDAALGFIDKIKETFSGSPRKNASRYVANMTEFQDRLRDILKSLKPKDLNTLREYGANPDKWSPQAQADATAALNGDEVAMSRLGAVQQRAVQRTLLEVEDDLKESRDETIQQRFGGKLQLKIETVKEADIQRVVDTLIPSTATISNAADAITLLNTMTDNSPGFTLKVNNQIRKQFGEYLNRFSNQTQGKEKESRRETEVKALRAFTYQAAIGRVVEIASGLQAKGGKVQKKQAATLLARATAASQASMVFGSLDSTTAARVLRFAQLLNGGDVATMLHEINADIFRFVEKKTGLTPQQVESVVNVDDRKKAMLAEIAAFSVTPEGKRLIAARKKTVSQLKDFAKRVRERSLRQSRETAEETVANKIDALVAEIEADYSQADVVLEKIAALIEDLPLDQQAEAGNYLEKIFQSDDETAGAEKAVTGKSRKIDAVAQRMIDSVNGVPPKRKKVSQEVADFAAIRLEVRKQNITPEQAVEAFVALGGNPELSESLLAAFSSDVNNVLNQESLEQDAKASQDLIKEIGEKVAKEEDFQKRVEKAGDDARKAASDELTKMVGEDVAKEENFQKQVAAFAEKAAAKAEADARKAEADVQKAVKAATRVFGSFDVRKPTAKRSAGITQIIQDVIMSHPEWDISDPEDKKRIMTEALKGKGIDPATIEAAVNNAVDVFNVQLEKLQQQQANTLLKQIERGKVKQEDLFKAIRLQILDPSKGLETSLAALNGWKGLSEAELANLYEVGERARTTENQQVRVGLLIDQMRTIYKSTGLAPEFRDMLSAGIRASAYGGMGSLLTNFTAPVAVAVAQLTREFTADVARNPTKFFELLGDHMVSFLSSVKAGYQSGVQAFQTEATKAFNVSKDTASGSKTMTGIVDVDALTRQFDLNLQVIKNPKSSLAAKSKAGLEMVWSSQRIVWKVLGAADSLAISTIEKHLTNLNIYRELRKDGERPSDARDQFDVYYGAQEAATRYAVDQLKLSPNAARLEAQTRVDQAFFDWLRDTKKVEPKPIQEEALREAVSMLGNHAEVQGRLSSAVNWLSEGFSSRNWNGLGPALSGPIRIVGNIADMAMWWTPGYGIYRAMREKSRKAKDLAAGRNPGDPGSLAKFHLHALTDYQLQRRRNEGIAGTILAAGVLSVLSMQPDDDDDKWLEITTAYPAFNPQEQARWKDKGLKEYTMYMGRGKDRTYISFTRGAFDFLTFPMVLAARTDKLLRGKTTNSATIGGLAYDAVNLALPSITSNARSISTLQQGKDTLRDFAASRLASFQPYSAMTRSIGKITEDPINKDASGFQWSTMLPVAALLSDEGEIELRNALDEKVPVNNTFWRKMAALGLPIGISEKSEREDSQLNKDFSKMGYMLPPGYTFNQLQTDVKGREAAVLKANGVDSLGKLFEKVNSSRAAAFKEIYKSDPPPSDQADDQRFLAEIINSGEPDAKEAFKKRMSTFWTKATKSAKETYKIKSEE